MRWVWIDRFETFCSGQRAVAIKCVSAAESHVHDVYPGFPVLPPSLVIEGLAQTGGILVGEANDFREKVVLAKIPHVIFHDYAVAGDLLRYEVVLLDLKPEGARVEAKVVRRGEVMVDAEIVFAHLDQSRGLDDDEAPKNFVFTRDHLMGLLKMAGGDSASGNPLGTTAI